MGKRSPAEPTAAAVEQAIQLYLRLPSPIECTRSSEGGEHVVWYIGTDYVFRALRNSQEAVTELEEDAAIRQLVRQRQLNGDVVPRCIGIVTVDDWVGHLDDRIRGVSLESRRATRRTETNLANFVRALWSTPVDEAQAIVGFETETAHLADLISSAHVAWRALQKSEHAIDPDDVLSKLLQVESRAYIPNDGETRVLLHNDLKGEHIILKTSDDENDGALAGVIDWSDAAIGDVAIDVGGLSISLGQRMAKRIATNAGVSPSAVARGIAMAMCGCIIRLNDRINGDDSDSPVWLLRSQFQRAFEGTSLEDALV